MAKSIAIVLAGGSGSRVGGAGNKVYLRIGGLPLLCYTLGAFERASTIGGIVVVVRSGEHELAAEAARLALAEKTVAVVTGGASRQASEWSGLDALRAEIEGGEVDVVAVHDGARPFVPVRLIDVIVRRARNVGGAVPGITIDEPLFERTSSGPRRIAAPLVRMQTPQAFRSVPLLAAHDRAKRSGDASAADTAETVERFGRLEVCIVPGSAENLKVTFASDLAVAEELAQRRMREWRVGRGGRP